MNYYELPKFLSEEKHAEILALAESVENWTPYTSTVSGKRMGMYYYQTDMTLYGLDEFNNERIQFTYTKAFPVTIGSINYNYRTAEEITSSMTFVYSQIHTKLISY